MCVYIPFLKPPPKGWLCRYALYFLSTHYLFVSNFLSLLSGISILWKTFLCYNVGPPFFFILLLSRHALLYVYFIVLPAIPPFDLSPTLTMGTNILFSACFHQITVFYNSSAFRLHCYGLCPFQMASDGGQIPSWPNLHVLTDFALLWFFPIHSPAFLLPTHPDIQKFFCNNRWPLFLHNHGCLPHNIDQNI